MTQKPYTVCLTSDFDAVSAWQGDEPTATAATLSRGEYGALAGVPQTGRPEK